MKKFLLILLFVMGCGGPTPYQGIGQKGGYFHQRINENTYKVVFRGNGYTSYKQSHDYAIDRKSVV